MKKSEIRQAIGARYRALRLSKGFQTAKSAANALAVNEVTYRAVESGRRGGSSSLLNAAVTKFEVSADWILLGDARTPTESELNHLALTLMRSRTEPLAEDVSRRLVRMRSKAGYGTASEAAVNNGWPLSRYIAHENRRKNVGVDAAVSYSLAFKGSVEWLLFGETGGDSIPASITVGTTSRESARAAVEPATAPRWMMPWRRGIWAEIPLLVGSRFEITAFPTPLILPMEFLPAFARDFEQLFGFAIPGHQSDGGWRSIALLAPEYDQHRGSISFDGWKLHRTASDGQPWRDPVRRLSTDPVPLGQLISELRFGG